MGKSPQVLGQAGLLIGALKKGSKEREGEAGKEGVRKEESAIQGSSGRASVVERFPNTHVQGF